MPLFYLFPDGVHFNDSHVAVGAATLNECVDDAVATPDNDGTYGQVNTSAAIRKVRFTLTNMTDVVSISRISIYLRASYASSSSAGTKKPFLYLSATQYSGVAHPADGPYVLFSDTWLTNPDSGSPWTKADLDALVVGVETSVDAVGVTRLTQLYVEVEAVALPAKLGAARHRGSTELHLRRGELPLITGRFGLLGLDREILEHGAWQHYAGPTVKDEGWGIKPWQRRLGALIRSDFDLDALEVTLVDLDLRRYLVSFRDTLMSKEVPTSQNQGVLRLDPGAGRVYVRSTAAWIENPSAARQGITQIVRIPDGGEKIGVVMNEAATLIEPQRTNAALRSAYINGLTGLTITGPSTVTADTALDHLLFEPAESPNNLKMVAGNPHTAAGLVAHPATAAFAANDRIVVSYYHKDDGGEAMGIRIQRSSDSFYWNESTGWASSIFTNLMPISVSKYERFVSKVIDVGGGTPTITVRAVQPSGGTALRVNRGGHLQIEVGRSATSPIPTTTAAVTRNSDLLKIENFTGKVVYDPARGSGYVELLPNFNSVEALGGDVRTVFLAFKDVNNFDILLYVSGFFEFRRSVGGVVYTASKVQTLTRGVICKIAWRMTGADGEEDLAPYTISLFTDDVKGTDAVPGATWVPGAAEYLYIGQDQSGTATWIWDGGMRQFIVRPFVFGDDEMVDQP